MKQLVIGELTPELIIGKNIVLAPDSYDSMLELQLYMNSLKCTMFKMPVIENKKVEAVSRIKFELARRSDDNHWLDVAKKMINFGSSKERRCINLVSFTEHWQTSIEYYQEKGMEIVEIILPENYQCLFDEEIVKTCPFFNHYKKESVEKWIEIAKDIRFGSY